MLPRVDGCEPGTDHSSQVDGERGSAGSYLCALFLLLAGVE